MFWCIPQMFVDVTECVKHLNDRNISLEPNGAPLRTPLDRHAYKWNKVSPVHCFHIVEIDPR